MPHQAAVPFNLKRSEDVFSGMEVTSTTETIHGLLHLDGDRLVIQWRLSRQTDRMGGVSYESESELEAVREVVLPLDAVSGAVVRWRWWNLLTGPRLVLRASDLRAFEEVAGEGGLKLAHPAELVFRLRRADVLAAEEFTGELALALAERMLPSGEGTPGLRAGPPPPLPQGQDRIPGEPEARDEEGGSGP